MSESDRDYYDFLISECNDSAKEGYFTLTRYGQLPYSVSMRLEKEGFTISTNSYAGSFEISWGPYV